MTIRKLGGHFMKIQAYQKLFASAFLLSFIFCIYTPIALTNDLAIKLGSAFSGYSKQLGSYNARYTTQIRFAHKLLTSQGDILIIEPQIEKEIIYKQRKTYIPSEIFAYEYFSLNSDLNTLCSALGHGSYITHTEILANTTKVLGDDDVLGAAHLNSDGTFTETQRFPRTVIETITCTRL